MGSAAHKRLSFQTVGCRLNQYETEKMVAALYPYGFRRAESNEPVDLFIINTCTVTHRADATNRQLIQKAARDHPHARIVVAGCYVETDAHGVAGMEPVDVIISNRDKPRIAEILSEQLSELFDAKIESTVGTTPSVFERHNRAWLKISDGCNAARFVFYRLSAVRCVIVRRWISLLKCANFSRWAFRRSC
jgi:threonylcarbamoyladenosine tRNA methylthiotransferase MtaB